jgi:transketolase
MSALESWRHSPDRSLDRQITAGNRPLRNAGIADPEFPVPAPGEAGLWDIGDALRTLAGNGLCDVPQVALRAPESVSPKQIRRIVLTESKRANVGHIGSCLCVAEILSALYSYVLRAEAPRDPERDRFVLSKGHAGLALYAALHLKGWLSEAQLGTFCGDDTLLGVHPEAAVPGVDFSSGSLGQGLGMAVGAALAARLQGSGRRAFCLISDGECNEGSIWEAAMFAAQQRLSNLHVIVDRNGVQAFGRTRDVVDTSNLADRWRAFGWRATEVDGHSVPALAEALLAAPAGAAPRIVVANTTFGKGVSYMEQGLPLTQRHIPVQAFNWHYLPMSEDEFRIAMEEVECGR